jgi:sigma-B regulation protein RsbU (phosphoserine phosphatase)
MSGATTFAADDSDFKSRISPAVFASPILVADDQKLNLDLICGYLRHIGFSNLDVASHGALALEKVRANRPELLILDIMMPGVDGLEVCRALRAEAEFADLPILVQTALRGVQDRVEIFRAGATDLIVKPVNRLELIARVGVHLERRLLIRSLRQAGERIERELQAARAMQVALLPSLDHERALARHGLDMASIYTTSSELGGDFWGLIDGGAGAGWPGFYIADFAGHGVMSALNTIQLHTLIQQMAVPPDDPGKFLRLLNAGLHPLLPIGQFATATCVFFDFAANTLSYAAAGSPPPLLRASDGSWHRLDSAGVPLGIARDSEYTTRTVRFERDALMFLYSDALTESLLASDGRLGEDGVQALASGAPCDGARAFLDDVIDRFRAKLAGPPDDDLTGIAVRRTDRDSTRSASGPRE